MSEPNGLDAKLDRLTAAVEAMGGSASWFDGKGLVLFALGALLSFGGSWTATQVKLATFDVGLATVRENLGRVERRHDALEDKYNAHVQTRGAHATGISWLLTDTPGPTPPLLPMDGPPCCGVLALGAGR